ncbi:hypothetical protein QBC44DRAFT_374905 [Cladorrhinum sp. PSN332]|nr:hypothetical protein QBC44DRAFT_374905 [Cladorrhinum sp. PSN332]
MAQVPTSFEYLKWERLYEREKPYEVFIPLSSFGDKKDLVSQHVYTLDNHGFQFARHNTTVQALRDSHQVTEKYVPEMQNFLEKFLGEKDGHGVRTLCFDIRLRRSMDPAQFAEKTVNLEDGFDPLLPATHPHIDQSATGAIRRVLRHLGEEDPELLKGRVRIIKDAETRVTAWPLAVCDANSLDPGDLVPCDIVRRRFVGETLFAKFHPEQKWHYLSGQNADEIALLQIYDSSAGGQTKSKMVPSELHA